MSNSEHKSGFISLIGSPNVGKSTLLNQILGQKLAIVTPKPQTTRNKILGVKTLPDAQLIFLDTPGIYTPRCELDRRMMKTTHNCLKEVDLVMWLIDANLPQWAKDKQLKIAETLKDLKTPVFLLINKIDLMSDKLQLLPLIEEAGKWLDFKEIIPISALEPETVPLLIDKILPHMSAGPRYFPEDVISDQPERFLVAEIIREQVYNLTYHEIPYSTAVGIENMKENDGANLVSIEAVIYVEQDSQKGILVGKGGKLIKQIGTTARKEIEQILDTRVYLNLWVKVRKDWRHEDKALNTLGY